MRTKIPSAMLVAAMLAAPGLSGAQEYPAKPVHLFLGVPAGTTTDVVARLFTDQMRTKLGQPIIVESKPGANLTIAANYVAKAEPDGYTLFFSPAFVFNPVFVRNNPVDALKEFAAVSLVTSSEYMMFGTARIPAKSWKEVLDWAKANPGKLNFGAVAPGFDLIMKTLSLKSGIAYTSVPYAGGSLVLPQMLSGEVHLTMSSPAPFIPHMKEGTIRALFSTGRSDTIPSLATAGDIGFPDIDNLRLNFYLWAPLRTPGDIVHKASEAAGYAAKQPAVIAQVRKLFGTDPIGSTPEEARRVVEKELNTWSELARAANFRPQ